MIKVCLMEFDRTARNFQLLREVTLASTPAQNDKVVIDIDRTGYVFTVYDVHFAENSKKDVNVTRHSTITDYQSSGFPDIV